MAETKSTEEQDLAATSTEKQTNAAPRDRARSQEADGEAAVLEKIAAMPEPYRAMGERLHALILQAAPDLQPRTWYGMPGYAKSKSSPVLLFFRADKYMTFGLTEHAHFSLDEDAPHKLMQYAWFFTALDEATENRIMEIVRGAVR